MPAIPSALIQRLRDTLARCPALESDRALRAVFIDTRLAPWLNRVPENTTDRAGRVNALIAALCDQSNARGDNALVLFLHTLADNTNPTDALHAGLATLAADLAAYPPADLAALKPAVQSPVRLPPFAIITCVIAILLIAIIALANFPTARDQLTTLFQSRAFPRERKGETLIVIATFHRSEGVTDTEPHEKIRRAIEQAQAEVGFTTLRVAVEPTRLRADDRAGAQALGDRYDASLIIWGEDTGVEVRVNFYNRKQPADEVVCATDVRIVETRRTQIAAPSAYAEFITQDLPAQLTFLSLYAIGQSYYAAADYPASARAIEAAVVRLNAAQPFESAANAYFRLGWLYQVPLPDLPLALAAYTRAIELNLNYACVYNNRGGVYLYLGEYALALTDFTRALELDPDNAYAYNNRGETYRRLGEYDLALNDFVRAFEFDPDYASAYNNRGLTYHDLGEYALALADYTRAFKLDPDLAGAYKNRGFTYYALGEYNLALADYTRALELDPDFIAACINRGNTYRALGEHDLALADYTHALELDPNDAAAYNNRGITYDTLGEYDLALADYTRALELAPDYAAAYNNRGGTYLNLSEYTPALADFTRALELDPDYAAAYNNRGGAYRDLGEYALAFADYTRALELDPGYVAAYYNRGLTYHVLGEYALSLADYTRALELDPDYAGAYDTRGITYANLGEYDLALADLTHALELDPDYAGAYNNRGLTYHDLGEYDLALADLTHALELDPDTSAYSNRGITYDALGKYALALADYTRALELDLTNADAYYFGARAHAALGDVTAACTWLENALALVPQGVAQARNDEAFASIRDESCFQALTNGE